MRMKRLMLWTAAVAVAGVAAACSGSENSPGFSPTPASGNGSSSNAASAAATAKVASACGFSQDGNVTVGVPPTGADPGPTTSTGSQSGGADPNNPPPAGAEVMLVGPIGSVTGTCPALTLTLAGKAMRTTAATSFPSGSCDSIRSGGAIGAVGMAQADGSISARCVASL